MLFESSWAFLPEMNHNIGIFKGLLGVSTEW